MPTPDKRIRYLEEVRPGVIPTGPQPVNRRHDLVDKAIDQARSDQILDNLVITQSFQHAGDFLSYFGQPAIGQGGPFVQSYATADQTLGPYTPDDESAAYSGIISGLGGTPYASLTDLNALRTAYTNLEASHQDLMAFVNSLINFLQLRGDLL